MRGVPWLVQVRIHLKLLIRIHRMRAFPLHRAHVNIHLNFHLKLLTRRHTFWHLNGKLMILPLDYDAITRT